MCVILHAKKKKHMKREEIQEAMRTNSAGFYMAALRKGSNNEAIRLSTRTMVESELLKFFDEIVNDDDEVVMHARIPSYGPKDLSNVHGWEIDGIQFCHNMSIRSIDGFRDQFENWKNLTDSEFFFTKLFIPYYRSLGSEAFKNGKFHEDLDKFVKWICGTTNKFCFVMPDNTVIRYGNWVSEADRKENGEVAFYASNSSYKVYRATWPAYIRTTGSAAGTGTSQKGGTAAKAAAFPGRRDLYDYDYDYDYDEYRHGHGGWVHHSDDAPAKGNVRSEGEVVLKCRSYKDLAKTIIQDLVLCNASALKELEIGETPDVSLFYIDNIPKVYDHDVPKFVTKNFSRIADGMFTTIIDVLEEYAEVLEDAVRSESTTMSSRYAYLSEYECKKQLMKSERERSTLAYIFNLVFNFDADKPEDVATMFTLSETRTGKPTMKKVSLTDLIVPEIETLETMKEAIEYLLIFIHTDDSAIEATLQNELIGWSADDKED